MAEIARPGEVAGATGTSNGIVFKTKEVQVADYIRERIMSGEFHRGQKLKQAEIAKALNFSITPVREAFKQLEADGYLIGASHRGVVVAPFQVNAVEELFELRMELETRLTREAIVRMTPALLETLQKIDAEIREAAAGQDHAALRRANYRFHFMLYEAAEQPQTLHFVRILWAKYPFDLLTMMPYRMGQVADEHTAFLQHLAAEEPQKAVRAMRAHIESGWTRFKNQYGGASSRPAGRTTRRS